MSRQTISEHSDSDQIISDEEDFNGGNGVSLSVDSDRKEGLLLQSRLEILRAKEELSIGADGNFLQKTSTLAEEEVEAPDFPNEDGLTLYMNAECIHNVDKDYVQSKVLASQQSCQKADVRSLAGAMKHEAWPMVSEEAKALHFQLENSSSGRRQACKPSRGVKGRSKQRFSFQLQPSISCDKNVSVSNFHERSSEPEAIQTAKAETKVQGDISHSDGENERWSEVSPVKLEPVEHVAEHSIAELLEDIQEKNCLPKANSNSNDSKRGKRLRQAVKRSLRDGTFDRYDEESERLSLGSSSDEEVSHQAIEPFNPEKKGSMVDLFQEALATSLLHNQGPVFSGPNLSSNGLLGKLQLVVQSEKQTDANFVKKLQMGTRSNDVNHSITVKILSRYLEAKLTICLCSFANVIEEASQPGSSFIPCRDGEMKNTVVFNPRVCSDVELEVGNWICIQPPWNEVQVMGTDDTIILSSYFYQVLG